MQVISSDDDGVGHLDRVDHPSQNTSTDGDVTGEGAFLVWQFETSDVLVSAPSSQLGGAERVIGEHTDVGTVDGLSGSLESQTDVFVPTLGFGGDLLTA